MEPETRFCTSADGTRIAYHTLGEPAYPALVVTMSFDSTFDFAWHGSNARRLFEQLAQNRRLVTFDSRGVAGSQRDVADVSISARADDLLAVVDDAELRQFDLTGWGHGSGEPVLFTARHPERVRQLVLWHPALSTSAPLTTFKRIAMSIRTDWSLARRSFASVAYPVGPSELQRNHSRWLRDSVEAETAARLFEAIADFDASDSLKKIRCPTLVLLNSDSSNTAGPVKEIAVLIPDVRIQSIQGDFATPTHNPAALVHAINGFLNGADMSQPSTAPPTSGFATILFTDMQSSTALTQNLGDAGAQEVRRAHNEIVRSALDSNGGNEIKHTGDGIMASFATASSALDSAIAIQRGVAAHKEEHPDSPLGVYVGLNAGEPIAEDDPDGRVDLFGTSVNLAARLVEHAKPGQIIASDVVRQLAAGKQFLFADLGETELRGFEDPVKLWELRWQETT